MNTQETSAEKLLQIIEEKDRKIAELEQQIQWFMSQIRLAKHKQYGASSEKTDSILTHTQFVGHRLVRVK